MTARLTLVTTLLVLGSIVISGCAEPARPAELSARKAAPLAAARAATNSAPQIYMTGMVLHDDIADEDVVIDLTADGSNGVEIGTYLPIRINYDATFHVHHEVGGRLHDYDVLVGPDPQRDWYAQMQFETSDAAPNMEYGWIIVVGRWPLAETAWVSGSAPGSCFAMRIKNDPNPNLVQHYVYNLDDEAVVVVEWKEHGQTLNLPPGKQVIFTATMTKLPGVQDIPTGDEFVGYMRGRAAVAGVDLEQ